MAEAVQIAPETTTDIVALVEQDPTPFLTDKEARRDFMDHVREVALTAGADVSTAKSRQEIISMAAKVTKCKTTIDNAGKEMTEEWRLKTAAVNEARREVRDDFTQLAADVRRPVTEWEEAEKARQALIEETLSELRTLAANPAPFGATSQMVRERIAEVEAEPIDPDVFGDKTEWGEQLHADALTALRNTLARIEKEEADQAELDRLRKAEAEREERERAEREAREAEERKAAEEKARAEREAEEAKRREEEQKRAAEEAERRAEQRAEQARREERERIEREQREAEAQQKAKEEAERKEAERLARNKKHRQEVMGAATRALVNAGIPEEHATKAVTEVAAGAIPHVSIQF